MNKRSIAKYTKKGRLLFTIDFEDLTEEIAYYKYCANGASCRMSHSDKKFIGIVIMLLLIDQERFSNKEQIFDVTGQDILNALQSGSAIDFNDDIVLDFSTVDMDKMIEIEQGIQKHKMQTANNWDSIPGRFAIRLELNLRKNLVSPKKSSHLSRKKKS
jgi:hypothetical protein